MPIYTVNWFSTTSKPLNGKRTDFKNDEGKTDYLYVKEWSWTLTLYRSQKLIKMAQRLNLRANTTEFLEKT